jgi:hypothetical protein
MDFTNLDPINRHLAHSSHACKKAQVVRSIKQFVRHDYGTNSLN